MKIKKISQGFLLLLFVSAVFVYCSKSNGYNSGSGGMNNAQTTSVSIKDMVFSPASLSVSAGTTVTWYNYDAVDHTVTADDASFDSGNIPMGGKYSKTFTSAGTFSYHCTLHPEMKATVTAK
jgi:plastocyanin